MTAGGHALPVKGMVDRSVLAHPLFTGVSRPHLSPLVGELTRPWVAGDGGRLHQARGGARKRAAGAGARHRLMFVNRLVATLIHLRHDLPHAVLALLDEVDRSTRTRAVGEVRRLLAGRGCAVPERPGLRPRPLEDVFAYVQAERVRLRLDATAARTAGIARRFPTVDLVQVLLDDGYLDLSRDRRGKALTQPRKLRPGATLPLLERNERRRHEHSSQRITVEHALADHEHGKQPTRWTPAERTFLPPPMPSPPSSPTATSSPEDGTEQGRHVPPATELDWAMSDRSPDGGRSVPVALNCEIRAGRRVDRRRKGREGAGPTAGRDTLPRRAEEQGHRCDAAGQ
ncbi:DDE superfamily endonuclease [Streptomyces sp. PanSC19]|nr:DDE superfamily endonuclease [Streptomyces sp. PanSC19]